MEYPVVEIVKDILRFLKSPKDKLDASKSNSNQWKTLWTVIFIHLLLSVSWKPFKSFIDSMELYESKDHAVGRILENDPWWLIIIVLGIIVPFLEEIIFRSWLRFPGKWNNNKEENPKIWNTLYPYIFYLSAVLFAAVHLTNYPDLSEALWITPFLVITQFIGGVLNGYLRVKQGLASAMVKHMFFNLILISISFAENAMDNSTKKIEDEKESYRFYLEETDSRDKTSVAYQNILANCLDTEAKFIGIEKRN